MTATSGQVAAIDHRFEDLAEERSVLAPCGFEVKDGRGLSEDESLRLAADADGVLIGPRLKLDRARLERLARCRAIVRYGVGVDNIDMGAARALGISVSPVCDYAVEEVATHALAMLLAMHRRLPAFDSLVRTGEGVLAGVQIPRLSSCTLGVVGFGRIGRELAHRAQPLGLRLLVSDPGTDEKAACAAGGELLELAALVAEADFVSLHLPLTDKTRGLFDEALLARFKPGAILVNTSRGGLINERALVAALREGRLAGAALDTTETEPLPEDDPLLLAPNLMLTPHMAWLSDGAQHDLQLRAAQRLAQLLRSEFATTG